MNKTYQKIKILHGFYLKKTRKITKNSVFYKFSFFLNEKMKNSLYIIKKWKFYLHIDFEKLEKSQKFNYFTIFIFFKWKNEKFLTYHQKMKILIYFVLEKLKK